MTPIHVKQAQSEPAARRYGPRLIKGAPRRCHRRGCGRPLPPESRRHECDRCRVAASRGLIVESPCACCGSRDLRVLGWAELEDGAHVLCANCKAILGRLHLTLAELRAELEVTAADVAGAA